MDKAPCVERVVGFVQQHGAQLFQPVQRLLAIVLTPCLRGMGKQDFEGH
jgi:hypothetical protein